jgi:hypothetical protein
LATSDVGTGKPHPEGYLLPLGWARIFDPPECKAAGGEPGQSVPVCMEQRKRLPTATGYANGTDTLITVGSWTTYYPNNTSPPVTVGSAIPPALPCPAS